MNGVLKLGLQGLPFGEYDYSAEVEKRGDELRFAKQNLRDLETMRANGATKTRGGLDINACIAACAAKVASKQESYDRAKAEL